MIRPFLSFLRTFLASELFSSFRPSHAENSLQTILGVGHVLLAPNIDGSMLDGSRSDSSIVLFHGDVV